jgi:hypothetical protein
MGASLLWQTDAQLHDSVQRMAPRAARNGSGTEEQIVFNAGTHGDAVKMRYEDFAAIAHPIVGRFARRPVYW